MLKITKLLLVFLFLTIVSVFSLLLAGIKIDSFSFNNINVSQFYIKLDKKLIVDIENIEYKSKKSQVESSYDDLKKNIELLPNILKIFKKVHVERLIIDGNEFTISLNEESIYLDNKFVNFSSKLDFLSHQVVFDMYSLHLKDLGILLDGKVKIDYFNEKLDYFGKYFYEDVNGELKLEMTQKIAEFYINSNRFRSLSFLKKFFRLSVDAEDWMYDNVQADIKLEDFYGQVDLERKNVIEKSLKGTAKLFDAKINFQKGASTVDSKEVDLEFKNGNLHINLLKPKYEDVDIDGSFVVIRNLASQNNGVVEVNIKSQSKLNQTILDLLKTYKIKIPLIQESGKTKTSLLIKVPYSLKKGMSTKGTFLVENAKIKANNFEFYTKRANVVLDGSIIRIKNSDFAHKEMLKATINSLNLDTNTLKANGNVLIDNFKIATKKQDIIEIKNKKSSIDLDFSKAVDISLSEFGLNIFVDDTINVTLKDLSKIYNYSEVLKNNSIKEGNLKLKINDEKNLSFNGLISKLDYPIFKDEKQVESLEIKAEVKDGKTYISSLDNNLKLFIDDETTEIFLKDYLVDLRKSDSSSSSFDFLVKGEDLLLRTSDLEVFLKKVTANIKNKKVLFEAEMQKLNIPLSKDDKKVDTLSLKGEILENEISIKSHDNKLDLSIKNDNRLDLNLDGYDILVDLKNQEESKFKIINLTGKNSNLIINENFKFLANTYEFRLKEDKSKYLHLMHDKTDITYKETKDGKIDIYGNDISDKFVNTIFDKEIIEGGKLMFLANGYEHNLKGKTILTNVKIKDLAIINNLLIFIHSSPALINPLLAVPSVVSMASNKGFNLTGYQIIDGVLEFVYDNKNKKLDVNKLVTVGNGIDFDGVGKVDLNSMQLDSKIKLIFFKDYSSIVGNIPVVNYVLLGENKRVATQVNIFGDLTNPKISTNLTKDAFFVPVNIGKRILESPVKLFEFIKDLGDK
ncbi:AsmA-like C-terminal domain-containing protein [Arcobacter sp. YIC-464]|uniref:YhdP family protein n=1 Tax=Arcobacter sp. YIC-464 TaxID=3376631 RepID=UPI003C22A630